MTQPPPQLSTEPAPKGQDNRGPSTGLVALAAFVALASVGTVIFELIFNRTLDHVQYGLTAALLCFSLSTISCLLFAAKVEMKAAFKMVAITLVGPGTMWIISLWLFISLIPKPDMNVTAPELKRLTSLVDDLSQSEGWSSFEDWKRSLGTLRGLFEDEEETNVKHLLNSAFIRARGRPKLDAVTIETLFVYVPIDKKSRAAFKLQHFSGRATASTDSLYMTAVPTLENGKAQSILFIRQPVDFTALLINSPSEWQPVQKAGSFDGMLVARYEDGDNIPGDWLQIHVPKYVSKDSIDLILGFATRTTDAIQDGTIALWEMRPTALSPSNDLPLVFRKRSDIFSSYALHKSPYSPEFTRWLEDLDDLSKNGKPAAGIPVEAIALLQTLRNALSSTVQKPAVAVPLSAVLDPAQFQMNAFKIQGESNPVILTFLWK